MDAEVFEIALFPLDLVAVPGGLFPLHIFEPRYKQLVADRLSDDCPFAICRGNDDASAEVGCAVDISGVLGKLPDGRLNIACRGYRRLRRVESVARDVPYAVIQAVWFDDVPGHTPADVMDAAREAYRAAASAKEWGPDLAVDVETDASALSWHLAEAGRFSTEARQALLETGSAAERLRTETRWLRAASIA